MRSMGSVGGEVEQRKSKVPLKLPSRGVGCGVGGRSRYFLRGRGVGGEGRGGPRESLKSFGGAKVVEGWGGARRRSSSKVGPEEKLRKAYWEE